MCISPFSSIFFLTVLLQFNLHTIQFTHLKYTNTFLIYSHNCATLTKVFSFLQKKLHVFYPSSPGPPLSSSPALGSQLSLKIFLLWTLHINGIIQYAVFCNWLLYMYIYIYIERERESIFSRFIHIVACFSPSFLFMAE